VNEHDENEFKIETAHGDALIVAASAGAVFVTVHDADAGTTAAAQLDGDEALDVAGRLYHATRLARRQESPPEG
jgi:hypothetical protein